jgi:hypothetical protein
MGKGGGGGPKTPAQATAERDLNAAYLSDSAGEFGKGVTMEQAQQFLDGTLDPSAVEPSALERMKKDSVYLTGLKSGEPKKYYALIQGGAGREAGNLDKAGTAESVAQVNVEKKRQVRDDLTADKASLSEAISAWKSISPKAQAILVQNGGLAPSQLMGALKSARLSESEQVAASRLQRLINEDIKRIAGSAVTATEGGRQGTAIGVAAGDYNPWQSPAVLTDYLKHARGVLEGRWNSASKAYPDLWEDARK